MYELTPSPSSPVDHAMNVAIRFDNTYSQLSNLTIEYSVIHLLKNQTQKFRKNSYCWLLFQRKRNENGALGTFGQQFCYQRAQMLSYMKSQIAARTCTIIFALVQDWLCSSFLGFFYFDFDDHIKRSLTWKQINKHRVKEPPNKP